MIYMRGGEITLFQTQGIETKIEAQQHMTCTPALPK